MWEAEAQEERRHYQPVEMTNDAVGENTLPQPQLDFVLRQNGELEFPVHVHSTRMDSEPQQQQSPHARNMSSSLNERLSKTDDILVEVDPTGVGLGAYGVDTTTNPLNRTGHTVVERVDRRNELFHEFVEDEV